MSIAEMLLRVLIQYGPDAYAKWVEILHKSDPTTADFLAVLDAISQETYQQFIDEARAGHPTPAPTPVPTPAPVYKFYEQETATKPTDAELFAGDLVYTNADKTLWYVASPGVAFTVPEGFTLDHTVTK